MTVADLCNHFLTAKRHLAKTGEISTRTFVDYYTVAQNVVAAFGKDRLVMELAADDFAALRRHVAKTRGPVGIGNEVQRVRTIFRYGHEAGLIDQPVRFGPTFKRPGRKVLRIERAKKGQRMLEAVELRRVIDKAGIPLKAMILLGLNCGFGNADVARLPIKALDLKSGWVNYPRPKTGIPRRCPLWRETVAAIQNSLVKRPKPLDKAHDGLVFLTKFKRPWQCSEWKDETESTEDEEKNESGEKEKSQPKLKQDDAVAKEFTKVLKALELHRAGLGFYCLRHTLETIGGDSGDQVAVDFIMGHSRDDMAGACRECIDDARLVAVTEHVRKWLFGEQEAK